jgi:hypothetical protein
MISDKATPDPRFPPLPVKLYPVGRFVVPVPEGLEFRSSSLSMNKIAVTEITWKPGKDREQQFRDLWMPVRDEARKNYDRRASMGRATQGGFAEQDLSELFGHPAMLLCYQSKRAWHHIDTFIALPEYVPHSQGPDRGDQAVGRDRACRVLSEQDRISAGHSFQHRYRTLSKTYKLSRIEKLIPSGCQKSRHRDGNLALQAMDLGRDGRPRGSLHPIHSRECKERI